MEILTSKEYGKFNTLLGNRKTDLERVKKIADSMKKRGYIGAPIIVNEWNEIIDGQHRFEACRQLGIEFPYIKKKNMNIKDCIELNRYQAKWKITDFIHSYAVNGNQNFKNLESLMNLYPDMPNKMVLLAVTGKYHPRIDEEMIVDGNTMQFAMNQLDFLRRMLDFKDRFGSDVRGVGCVLIKLYRFNLIDTDRMYEQCKKYASKFIPSTNQEIVVKQLNDIYNERLKSKAYFVDEFRKQDALLKKEK